MDPIAETYDLIKKYDIHARKRFGQNFLTDVRVLDKIVDAAEVTKEDFVLEIGPGLGTLTRCLCERAGRVLAVEIDYDLSDILERELVPLYDNLELVTGDILRQDVAAIAEKYHEGRPIKVVANLPYYITTPILMELMESRAPIRSITVMVQKEVAERMMAKPGDKDCGAISLAVTYYAEAYLAANVPPNCFKPRPKVSSAVIRLSIRQETPVHTEDEGLMFKLIRAAFAQRRKTLANAIDGSAELDYPKEDVIRCLEEAGLSPTVRGEKLDLETYALLSDTFTKKLTKHTENSS